MYGRTHGNKVNTILFKTPGHSIRPWYQFHVFTCSVQVGLGLVLELINELLQYMQKLLVAMVYRVENVRETVLNGIRSQAMALAELRPVRQIRDLPAQIQQLLRDLQELSKILLQLVINTTPLYNMVRNNPHHNQVYNNWNTNTHVAERKKPIMVINNFNNHVCLSAQLQRPSDQEVEDFLNQEDLVSDNSSHRSSANSLFLKAMDGRPRRRRSLHFRTTRGSGASHSPDPPNGRRSSLKDSQEVESVSSPSDSVSTQRRPSTTELLLTPLKQFVSQSQKAFEYLSPNSPENAVNNIVATHR